MRRRYSTLLSGMIVALTLGLTSQALAAGTLTLRAVLALGDELKPFALDLQVAGETFSLGASGELSIEREAGTYELSATVPGAVVEGPSQLTIANGETAVATFVVRPQVELSIEALDEMSADGRVRLLARATTSFAPLLPATLDVELNKGWQVEGATRVVGGLSATVPMNLEFTASAGDAESGVATAVLEPFGTKAEIELDVVRPAAFVLEVLATELSAAPGAAALLPVRLSNLGGTTGIATLGVRSAPGVAPITPVELTLEAGESRELLLAVGTLPDGPERVDLNLDLTHVGTTVASEIVALRRLQPSIAVEQSIALVIDGYTVEEDHAESHVLLPGDLVEISISLRNEGQRSTSYSLTPRLPEWLEAVDSDGTLRFQGALAVGARMAHSYRARVAYGPSTSGALVAELRYQDVVTSSAIELERHLVEVTTSAVRAVEHGSAGLAIVVINPLDRPLSLTILQAAEGAVIAGASELTLELAPDEKRALDLSVTTLDPGAARHTVSLLQAGVPVAASVTTDITVLPGLSAVRTAMVRIPFEVVGADQVLIRHRLPGTVVVAGSSRLDGVLVTDPVVDELGRAYWLLDAAAGELTYRSTYVSELTPADSPPDSPADRSADPTAPEMTGIFADREVLVTGAALLSDFAAAGSTAPPSAAERTASPLNQDHDERSSRLIVEPLDGQSFRAIDPVRIVIEGPANGLLPLVSVNGVDLGRENIGLIQTDSSTGTQRVEYYGLNLNSGVNVITARATENGSSEVIEVHLAGRPVLLEIAAFDAVADGRSPVVATIVARDDQGAPAGFGPLTIVSELTPLAGDAFPELSGHQVLLRDGRATIEFSPLLSAREIALHASFEALTATAEVLAVPTREELYHFHGSVTFGVAQGQSYLSSAVEAYAELPTENGIWQLAIDGRAHATSDVAPDTSTGLMPNETDTRFTEVGSRGTQQLALSSEDGIAVRYTEPGLDVTYAYGAQSVPGVGAAGRLTSLSVAADLSEVLELSAFTGLVPATVIEQQIVPDGTRRYELSQAPRAAGETVLIRVQTTAGLMLEERVLLRGSDYTIDPVVGAITLARPLWPVTPELHDVLLVIRYAPAQAPRDQLAAAAGVRYDDGAFSAEVGAARVVTDTGPGYRMGAGVGYRAQGFGVRLDYLRKAPIGGLSSDRFAATFYFQDDAWLLNGSATYEQELQANLALRYAPAEEPWKLSADLTSDADRGVTGAARIAYDLPGAFGIAALEHDRRASDASGAMTSHDVTSVVYEHLIERFLLGAGAGYDWQARGLEALARAAYEGDTLSFGVEHRQPLSTQRQAHSELTAGLSLAGGTDLRATLDAAWGGDVAGRIALLQPLGPAQASVSYELPTASGAGNRLNFGVETPWQVNDALGIDLHAGYLHSFADDSTRYSAGAAANYTLDRFQATLAGEVAVEDGDLKVVTRFGASGSPAEAHSLSLSGDFTVVPDVNGALDLSYAYRGSHVSVLSYHRLVYAAEASLEGELAVTLRPSAAWQFRPSAAYRWLPADPGGSTVQLGAGVTAYPIERLGIGANGFYVTQPASGNGALIWGLEGSYQPNDTTTVAIGYSFGANAGITPESRGGFYLRFDLFGGNR